MKKSEDTKENIKIEPNLFEDKKTLKNIKQENCEQYLTDSPKHCMYNQNMPSPVQYVSPMFREASRKDFYSNLSHPLVIRSPSPECSDTTLTSTPITSETTQRQESYISTSSSGFVSLSELSSREVSIENLQTSIT